MGAAESMNFEQVLGKIIKDFEKGNLKYALIGGFALGLWGVVRATADLDFLIDKEQTLKVKNTMRKYGYKCFYESENILQYASSENLWGEIDYLYAFRKPSLAMLRRAVEKKVFEGKLAIKVLIPEDLIGLKIQASINNPARGPVDYSDIEQLIERNSDNISWDIIRRHFLLFNLDKQFKALKEKYA